MADTTTRQEELEQKLTSDLKHTLKLVPQSQRELFVSELALYFTQYGDTRELEGKIDELRAIYGWSGDDKDALIFYPEHRTDDFAQMAANGMGTRMTVKERIAELTALKDNHIVPGPEMVDKETK